MATATLPNSTSDLQAGSPLSLLGTMQIDAVAAAEGQPALLPRFRMVAYTGGPMRVAGWRYPVIVDLAGLAIPSQHRPIRFGHDAAHGVGHTDSIRVEGGQLIASGLVSRDTSAAREVVTSSKNGFPWQASIGAGVEEFEFVKEGQRVIANGRSFDGPVNVVRKATLGEISFVDLGADGNTSASVNAHRVTLNMPRATTPAQSSSETPTMEPTTPTAPTVTAPPASPAVPAPTTPASATAPAVTAATAVTAVVPPIVAPAAATTVTAASTAIAAGLPVSQDPTIPSVAQIRADALAESQRVAAIRKLCGAGHEQIESQAIAEGWDPIRCELEVLRAARPKPPVTGGLVAGAPGAIVRMAEAATGIMLEAACMLTAKLEGAEQLYDEQTLDAASRRFRGGIALQELLLEAAWANGYTGRNFREARAVLRYAFGQDVQAGFSSIDIGGILSSVANKFLLDGFFAVERVWRNICAVRNVSDFKTVTSYRLIGTDQYEQVAPGGELKHGSLGNESYSNKADTYGLMLSIDRRDIINDDLGAITTVPRKLGRGSGLKINDVFWSTFLNNAAFFAAGNRNYLAGADTALSIDGLTKAEQAFMDQVDSDGKPIGLMPSILLVPTALSAVATQLNKSMEVRDTTGNTKYPIANPHQGKFRPEVCRYLGNTKLAGNSQKAWYLLADPNDLPVIEVAFLNGQESPTIETTEADFNVLGVQMRGYHDFGCSLQDPRGGVKSKGEV